jgi:hypothetical protein
MPKNRSTVYTVVREARIKENVKTGTMETWVLQTIPGVFLTLQRAEEVRDSYRQAMIDAGMPAVDSPYRFSVIPATFYDE